MVVVVVVRWTILDRSATIFTKVVEIFPDRTSFVFPPLFLMFERKGKERSEMRKVRLTMMGGGAESKVLQDQFPMSGIFMYKLVGNGPKLPFRRIQLSALH